MCRLPLVTYIVPHFYKRTVITQIQLVTEELFRITGNNRYILLLASIRKSFLSPNVWVFLAGFRACAGNKHTITWSLLKRFYFMHPFKTCHCLMNASSILMNGHNCSSRGKAFVGVCLLNEIVRAISGVTGEQNRRWRVSSTNPVETLSSRSLALMISLTWLTGHQYTCSQAFQQIPW